MIAANILVYRIPAARRAMDLEDRDCPGPGYESSQRALSKIGIYAFGIAFVMVFLGVWIFG
jgi:hypothetical protein